MVYGLSNGQLTDDVT